MSDLMNHSTKSSGFFRLPPDSTGKRMITGRFLEVTFIGASGMPVEDDEIIGETSGVITMVVKAEGTAANGKAVVFVEITSPVNDFVPNEALTLSPKSGAAAYTFANLNGSATEIHAQGVRLVGANNPFTAQHVDNRGSAYVRFTEGAQQLDSIGISRFNMPTYLMSYTFDYEAETWRFLTVTAGTGARAWDANEASVLFDVGSDSGAKCTYTSHRHFTYMPGWGLVTGFTVASGDSGKDGCRRRWGFFNEQNGVFFQQNGTNLCIVLRSSVTGVPVDTEIHQTDWNVDEANGGVASQSGIALDVTKLNTYWFDFQFLGTGRIRCGIYTEEGNRAVLHEFRFHNKSSAPIFSISAMPVRYEIENLAPTASPSRLKIAAVTVKVDGNVADAFHYHSHRKSVTAPALKSVGTTEIPVLSIRPGTLFGGKINRMTTMPHTISMYTDKPVIVRVRKAATLTSPVWTSQNPTEWDYQASATTAGTEVWSFYLTGAETKAFPDDIFSLAGEALYNKADGSQGDAYTVTAQVLNPVDTANVGASVQWVDIGC